MDELIYLKKLISTGILPENLENTAEKVLKAKSFWDLEEIITDSKGFLDDPIARELYRQWEFEPLRRRLAFLLIREALK